jgi:hypothetical protein
MFLSVQVVTLDVFVLVTTCKDKNINGYNLQRQKHQSLQPANTKTSRVTTCTDKNIKGYNL